MKLVIKTPFDQLREVMERHWCQPLGGKSTFDAEQLASIKAMAAELPLSDIEEDVPLTDGELLEQAIRKAYVVDNCWDQYAAEFLRLRAERDAAKGEPLEVTRQMLDTWENEYINDEHEPPEGGWLTVLTSRINAHRGVRPVPKVTKDMWRDSYRAFHKARYDAEQAAADYINAELAKQAGKDGE